MSGLHFHDLRHSGNTIAARTGKKSAAGPSDKANGKGKKAGKKRG
ncbi:hypothetical protein GCM10010169_09690 [Micromonospora fulviviridis]|nr:hypothetical protein GCM10010169_09690 [Micromonospora fulviviridis]